VGHLEEGADSFTWTPHFFHRWEMPVTMMPPILLWAEEDENHHDAVWSAQDIVPCYEWETPRLTVRQREDGAGWDRTIVLFKPLAHCDLASLAALEAGAREQVAG